MKKALILALSLAMLLTFCQPSMAAVTPKGELPIVDEPITLTIAMPISPKVEDINTNLTTLYVEETTGINLEFVELSPSDTATQINTIMTSGDLPDIFLAYDFPYDQLCSYVDAGLVADLTDLYEQYGDNVYNYIVADLGESVLSYVRYEDRLWAVPGGGSLVTDTYGGYYNRIQHRFLEALNMEMPRTLDDLYEYLVGVRDNDVNGNGDPSDEMCITSFADRSTDIIRMISQAYQFTDPFSYLKQNDGTVSFVANNDYFKEAVEYMKKLVDEGLIDPASFTQDESVLSAISARDGDNVAIYATGNWQNYMDMTGDEYKNLGIIPNLEGPYGYKSSISFSKPIWVASLVTSACEHPDVAFRLIDFFLSDDFSLTCRVGFEGQQWEKAEEGVIGRDGQQAWFSLLTTQEWVQPSTNVIWCQITFTHATIMNHCGRGQVAVKYPTADEIIKYNLVGEDSGEYLPSRLLMDPEDNAEFNELKSLIVSYVNQNVVQFALGDRSLDEWDAYVAQLDAMGLARYIELAQNAIDKIA